MFNKQKHILQEKETMRELYIRKTTIRGLTIRAFEHWCLPVSHNVGLWDTWKVFKMSCPTSGHRDPSKGLWSPYPNLRRRQAIAVILVATMNQRTLLLWFFWGGGEITLFWALFACLQTYTAVTSDCWEWREQKWFKTKIFPNATSCVSFFQQNGLRRLRRTCHLHVAYILKTQEKNNSGYWLRSGQQVNNSTGSVEWRERGGAEAPS